MSINFTSEEEPDKLGEPNLHANGNWWDLDLNLSSSVSTLTYCAIAISSTSDVNIKLFKFCVNCLRRHLHHVLEYKCVHVF